MGRFSDMQPDDGGEGSVDISPLLDCVFILLIFFIVTTTFVDEAGVEVDKPEAASAQQLDKQSLIFAVTPEGQVMHADRDVGVGGVQGIVRRALQSEDLPVIVQADEEASSGLMVRVIDEAKLGGADKVSIATKKNSG